MNTAVLVSNHRPDDAGGRAEKIDTRVRLLADRGWDVTVAHAPEPYVTGFPGTHRDLLGLTRRVDPDLVVSINNPFHLHLHGYLLARRTDTPWLAELRDPIYSHPDRAPTSPRTWAARLVESLVCRGADQVVWHDGIQLESDYFRRRYPAAADSRVCKLPPMGYEAARFEAAGATDFEQFTVTYAGSFYEGWIEPYTFLSGLGDYRSRGGEDLTAQFYGDWSGAYERAAADADVTDWIETHDPVPHEEIVRIMSGSDVLLYVGGDDPGNRRNLPSKLWDYVGAERPILAIVDPDFRAASFVREHDLGVVVAPGDAAGVADALAALRDGTVTRGKTPESFTRERSADVLAAVMDVVADGRSVTEPPI